MGGWVGERVDFTYPRMIRVVKVYTVSAQVAIERPRIGSQMAV